MHESNLRTDSLVIGVCLPSAITAVVFGVLYFVLMHPSWLPGHRSRVNANHASERLEARLSDDYVYTFAFDHAPHKPPTHTDREEGV